LALVLQRLATAVLEDSKSNLRTVLSAVHELGLAQKYFQFLHSTGDRMRFDLAAAANEARQCQDLLSQAQYHVARARRLDEEEREVKRKHDEERLALKQKVEEEHQKVIEEKQRKEQELIQIRNQFVEQSKSKLMFNEMEDKPAKKGRQRKGGEGDEWVTDGSGNEGRNDDGTGKKRKRHSGDEGTSMRREGKGKKRRKRVRSQSSAGSGDENGGDRTDDRKSRRESKHKRDSKKGHRESREDTKRPEKPGKYKSREFISSSDSDSGDNPKMVIADDPESGAEKGSRALLDLVLPQGLVQGQMLGRHDPKLWVLPMSRDRILRLDQRKLRRSLLSTDLLRQARKTKISHQLSLCNKVLPQLPHLIQMMMLNHKRREVLIPKSSEVRQHQ
jgi:RNA polymerase-associated protein CTR9